MKVNLPKFFLISLFSLITIIVSAQKHEVLYINHQYQELIKKCTPPKTENDLYWLAQVYDQQGKTGKAIDLLVAHANLSDAVTLQQLKADLYFKNGQYNKSLDFYTANSENSSNFFKLVKTLEFNGDYILAIDSIKHRIKTDSTNVELLKILANCYYKADANIMAINTYRTVCDINPSDLPSTNKLAILLLNTHLEGNVSEAITLAEKVLETDSINKRFLYIKGRGYYMLNNYNNALPCFLKLYDSGYKNLINCKHLGICEFRMEQYEASKEHLHEALLIKPDDIQTNLFLGKCHLETEQASKALEYFRKVDTLLLPPKEMMGSILWDRQLCYKSLKDYHKVDTLLRELTKYDSRADAYFYIAANYQEQLNSPKKALDYYELFLEKSSTPREKKQCSSLREIAERRIQTLKEDAFWEGEQ